MTERVYSLSGKPVEVASPGDASTTIPSATSTVAGIVKATTPIADVQTIQVTDIESAGLAIAAIGTTLAEVMQALRTAGIMEK